MRENIAKLIAVMSMLFLSALLISCAEIEQPSLPDSEIETLSVLNDAPYPYIISYTEGDGSALIRLPNEYFTKADFLYDFDYMLRRMNDTFPYFGVVERRYGLDIKNLARNVRALIEYYPFSMLDFAYEVGLEPEGIPALCRMVFWSILRYEFFGELPSMGHLDLWWGDCPMFLDELIRIAQEAPKLFAFLTRNDPRFRYYYNPIEIWLGTQPAIGPVITMEVLEEKQIAYINISTFSPRVDILRHHRDQLDVFYGEIREFEHLIIDIRDSAGGWSEFAFSLVMEPLWPDSENLPTMVMYVFYRDSQIGRELALRHIKSVSEAPVFAPESDVLSTVSELIEESYLPNLNETDLNALGYGFRINVGLDGLRNQNHPLTDIFPMAQRNPFQGQIWLLTSGINMSASAFFARLAKDFGFATLVGEPVDGHFSNSGGLRFHGLPNTGITALWDVDYLTDQYGRAFEEFPTEPHFFNRPGMDALETVLQMIKEM